jgi:hypothetical protein
MQSYVNSFMYKIIFEAGVLIRVDNSTVLLLSFSAFHCLLLHHLHKFLLIHTILISILIVIPFPIIISY